MSTKLKKSYPTTKDEGEFREAIGDVALRSDLKTKDTVVGEFLKGPLDTPRLRLLRAAAKLGVHLADEHKATYEAMAAKSAEHGKAVSQGIQARQKAEAEAKATQAEAEAEQPKAKPETKASTPSEDPTPTGPVNNRTADTPGAPERSPVQKIADYLERLPRDEKGAATDPLGSSSKLPPHPLRPTAPKSNS